MASRILSIAIHGIPKSHLQCASKLAHSIKSECQIKGESVPVHIFIAIEGIVEIQEC